MSKGVVPHQLQGTRPGRFYSPGRVCLEFLVELLLNGMPHHERADCVMEPNVFVRRLLLLFLFSLLGFARALSDYQEYIW